MRSNFFPASPRSFISQIKNSDVKLSEMNRYFSKTTQGLLHCVYEDITSAKSIYNLNERVQNTLDILNTTFPDCPIVLDSGGFQISSGKFDRSILDEYIDIYYNMIDNVEGYYRNFLLDIPPSKIFKSWEEVRELNDRSYNIASQKKKDNSIFVFHAHDWNLYKIWSELFDKYGDGFNNFSIGGVAAGNLGSLDRITVYALLFRVILEKCLKTNRKEINLHILGAGRASVSLTFLFALMRDFIENEYNVSFNITTDSSQHARISMGRKFSTVYDGCVYTIEWFSKNLNKNFNGIIKEKYICDELNNFCINNDIEARVYKLYNEDGKTNMTAYNLLCLYDVCNYIKTTEIINENVSDILDSFYNDKESFCTKCSNLLKRLNGNKLTKNMKKDIGNIIKFLNILSENDLIHVEQLLKQNSSNIFSTSNLLSM